MVTNPKLKNIKTLLVDDNEFIRNSMEIAFRQKGYPLRTAATAEDGLRKLATDHFEIIISDFKLPGINGLTFLKHAGGNRTDLIKILISACGDHATIATAYAMGVHDYLQKPFTLDTLWATLALHVERLGNRHRVIDLRSRRAAALTQEQVHGCTNLKR
ncbi:MAG: response regulator [Desulfobacterales bacterium]